MSGKCEEEATPGSGQGQAAAGPDFTALLEGARTGSGEAVRKLLSAAQDVNAVGVFFEGKTQRDSCALYEAVDAGNTEAVDVLLSDGGADVNIRPVRRTVLLCVGLCCWRVCVCGGGGVFI